MTNAHEFEAHAAKRESIFGLAITGVRNLLSVNLQVEFKIMIARLVCSRKRRTLLINRAPFTHKHLNR